MYKVKNNLAPEIVSNTFCLQMQSQYNLRQQTDFRIPSVRSVYQDCESTYIKDVIFGTIFLQNQSNQVLLSVLKNNQKLDAENTSL